MSDMVTFSAEIGVLFENSHSLSSLFNSMRMHKLGRLPPFLSKDDHLEGHCDA
jgi:hypothetical protein